MHRLRFLIATISTTVSALLIAPGAAHASSAPAPGKALHGATASRSAHECTKPTVIVAAGSEEATLSLTQCDGTADAAGLSELSVLARPAGVAKPAALAAADKAHGADVAPGIRRVDARLAERLEHVADHFRNDHQPVRIVLVSGMRAKNSGSYHASGRALDFRVDGIANDALVAFCKTLPDTGCGYYPNGTFVHMDVRDAGAGHVAWVDTSSAADLPREAAPVAAVAQVETPRTVQTKVATPAVAPASEATSCSNGALPAALITQAAPVLPAPPAAETAPAADVAAPPVHRKAKKSHRHFL